jgi:hypothetical protein
VASQTHRIGTHGCHTEEHSLKGTTATTPGSAP